MKTTLEIPDALYRQIKGHAAARGQTVKTFVNEAVQEKLARDHPGGWRSLFGKGPRPTVAHVQKIIDTEFSQVDLEDWK